MQNPVQVKLATAFIVGEVLWAGLSGPVWIWRSESNAGIIVVTPFNSVSTQLTWAIGRVYGYTSSYLHYCDCIKIIREY